MRAWIFAALLACACKSTSGNGGNVDAAPMGPMGIATYEGQYCSRSFDEQPLYTCSPDFPLTCANTYEAVVTADGGAPTTVQVFVCRLTCTPDTGCSSGDVCCPGNGLNGTMVHACVPARACDFIRDR